MTYCTVGMDIGSTSIKGVLYSIEASKVLVTQSLPVPQVVSPVPGAHELDPEVAFQNVLGILTTLFHSAAKLNCHIEAIAFTGQMHGGMIVDSYLHPLTNFITWQDEREGVRELLKTLRSEVAEVERLKSGSDIHAGYFGITLGWMMEQGFTIPSGSTALTIYDWCAARLANALPSSDPTSVAAWGLYDIFSKRWIPELLVQLLIPERVLPTIKEPGELLGTLNSKAANQFSVSYPVEIRVGCGDTQASFRGSGCSQDELLLNFGTGSQSLWLTTTTEIPNGGDLRYYDGVNFLATIPTLAGGKAYSLLADFFKDVIQTFGKTEISQEDIFSQMNKITAESGSGGLVFRPFFNGRRQSPQKNERASILQLNSQNFNACFLTRALLEGMVDEITAPLKETGDFKMFRGLILSGNGVRKNNALAIIAQERTGLPARLSPHEEDAAVGAAMLAIRS